MSHIIGFRLPVLVRYIQSLHRKQADKASTPLKKRLEARKDLVQAQKTLRDLIEALTNDRTGDVWRSHEDCLVKKKGITDPSAPRFVVTTERSAEDPTLLHLRPETALPGSPTITVYPEEIELVLPPKILDNPLV